MCLPNDTPETTILSAKRQRNGRKSCRRKD
jgi:hypothetical protein